MPIGDVFVNALLKARGARRGKQRDSRTLSVLGWEYDQCPLVLPSKTLSLAEKQVSIAKAISVKKDHLVKYPDYKFTLVSPKKGRGRYTVNRNRDIIDEARRATPIGKGAEGMELGRALEVEDLWNPSTPVT
ncbi:hypothetical protein ARMGADRAFT_1031068 [Armillaria gallica]|uniref:Uncharacterized protein n=1 Tax=Armillaria gallica TaxID=47427 RepID=A0A2H3DEE5_ARMGA|nr:hypothetical protein ARMGADRAFT_1031068 [Armillaria gallica]